VPSGSSTRAWRGPNAGVHAVYRQDRDVRRARCPTERLKGTRTPQSWTSPHTSRRTIAVAVLSSIVEEGRPAATPLFHERLVPGRGAAVRHSIGTRHSRELLSDGHSAGCGRNGVGELGGLPPLASSRLFRNVKPVLDRHGGGFTVPVNRPRARLDQVETGMAVAAGHGPSNQRGSVCRQSIERAFVLLPVRFRVDEVFPGAWKNETR
jgi:hypothetical protein